MMSGPAIGVDLGGTKISAGFVKRDGTVEGGRKIETHPGRGAEPITEDVAGLIEAVRREASEEAVAVGIGVAGQISRHGVVRAAPNLPFREEPLQEKVADAVGLPVVVQNDVKAAAFGEWAVGAGREAEDLVAVFVGTGVGGGVISGGRLLEGCNNNFGELGHLTLVAGGRQCRCRNRGCLEAYCGGWAIAELAVEALKSRGGGAAAWPGWAESGDEISALTVTEAYRAGDPLGRELVGDVGRNLGAGLVGIVNAFNPCLLILGGGVIEGTPELIGMAEETIRERSLEANLADLNMEKARLGPQAGLVGAAVLAAEAAVTR